MGYHSEGTAAQRRGYNTCHATGLRLLRNRDEADALRSITACSGPLLPPACSSQAAHWRFWKFSDMTPVQAVKPDIALEVAFQFNPAQHASRQWAGIAFSENQSNPAR